MRLAFAVILPLCPLASVAVAQDTDRPAKAKPSVSRHRICMTQNVTGSRMPVSVCHTQAEWDAIEKTKALPSEELSLPSGQH
ncbi:hypothetical protein [Sphingomonas sp. CROZ-RG-20F-R02-07]|uniref:hypothetical protein n=1 Tax=Sphingomonas sp. CROZ-RG-20F-R02-07 TaxID=2914832 RepID=UPI001F587107|nr:hypothetical protein [Sphingomonas sp. CROZ-RG-20F-R02-07]